jgi:hypothetical protein
MKIIYIIGFVIVICFSIRYYNSEQKIRNRNKKHTVKLSEIIEIVASDEEEHIVSDIEGIYDAPIYMPADKEEDNIFLLNQMDRTNSTVAYVAPDLSNIETYVA